MTSDRSQGIPIGTRYVGRQDQRRRENRGAFLVNPGSLFPALHRLEQRGWVKSEWGASATNRKAKYYRLTAAGRRQLKAETANWGRISMAITSALRPVEEA